MTGTEWKRLGGYVVSRRVALGMKTRAQLAEGIDLSYRALSDLENGTRAFTPGTYAMIEQALHWTPGSAQRVLNGQEPTNSDGVVGVDDRGEELFELPSERYETLHYPDGSAYPIPRDLLDRAAESRVYLSEHPEAEPQLRDLLQAIIDQSDLATLQDRIRQLTRPQRLKLSKIVDRLLSEGATHDQPATPAAPSSSQSGASSQASEGQEAQPVDLTERRNENRRNEQASRADVQWPAPDPAVLIEGPDGKGGTLNEADQEADLDKPRAASRRKKELDDYTPD